MSTSFPTVIKPVSIRLEASSACQLRCPSCPTATKAIRPVVGSSYLRAADFRALLDANPDLKRIELSNYGEIFLNPELLEILAYAHEKDVALRCDNGANLNHVRDEVLDGVVKYGLRKLRCSIDGVTQPVYEKYRVRGNVERVLENIRKINAAKAKYQSPYPELLWQFILFGHNQHELSQAAALAKQLGMKFAVKLSWDEEFSPLQDEAGLRELLGQQAILSRREFEKRTGRTYIQDICLQMWELPQVNWDGRMLGCCRNYWGEFGGNALKDGLHAAVNSEGMRYARSMLMGQVPERAEVPCTTCDIYLSRKRRGDWVKFKPATG